VTHHEKAMANVAGEERERVAGALCQLLEVVP
jgi:hypothetical protein